MVVRTSRDEWGFDWLAQFFAQKGFAVLQPTSRGSAGYGDAWFANNGFQDWKIAIGDVRDGAQLAGGAGLCRSGPTCSGRLVLRRLCSAAGERTDAGLFKAVIAVAPVTDLALLKAEGQELHQRATGGGLRRQWSACQ